MAGKRVRLAGQENLDWSDYIRAGTSTANAVEAYRRCEASFADQRGLMAKLIREREPNRVGCLGSGFLIDIPIETLFECDRETYLVDWIPNVSEEGLRSRIIEERSGAAACVFCKRAEPTRYCTGYVDGGDAERSVCAAFIPISDPNLRCESYVAGEQPQFLTHDITTGVAQEFARRAVKAILKSKTPEDAFRRSIAACRACGQTDERISIETGSLDFVTSSMVASQFDSEPYAYFTILLVRKFGRDLLLAREERLTAMMKRLRHELFRIQMEAHAREIHRLLDKSNGVAYFSVELFRSIPEDENYFLVHEIPTALEILGDYFLFDFDSIPAESALRSTQMDESASIVQCYVLKPKPEIELV